MEKITTNTEEDIFEPFHIGTNPFEVFSVRKETIRLHATVNTTSFTNDRNEKKENIKYFLLENNIK